MQDPHQFDYIDLKRTRNTLWEAACLIILGEIVALLANGQFSWLVTLIVSVEVVLFFILSFVALKKPYSVIFVALTIFIVGSILVAAVKPSFLGGSIVIKIFTLIHLVRAIPNARLAQLFLRANPGEDIIIENQHDE